MFIASKFQEIAPPSINDFVDFTNKSFTKKQIVM